MKRTLFFLMMLTSTCGRLCLAQEAPPPSQYLKSVNAQFYLDMRDSSVWHFKGQSLGWAKLGRYKDIAAKLNINDTTALLQKQTAVATYSKLAGGNNFTGPQYFGNNSTTGFLNGSRYHGEAGYIDVGVNTELNAGLNRVLKLTSGASGYLQANGDILQDSQGRIFFKTTGANNNIFVNGFTVQNPVHPTDGIGFYTDINPGGAGVAGWRFNSAGSELTLRYQPAVGGVDRLLVFPPADDGPIQGGYHLAYTSDLANRPDSTTIANTYVSKTNPGNQTLIGDLTGKSFRISGGAYLTGQSLNFAGGYIDGGYSNDIYYQGTDKLHITTSNSATDSPFLFSYNLRDGSIPYNRSYVKLKVDVAPTESTDVVRLAELSNRPDSTTIDNKYVPYTNPKGNVNIRPYGLESGYLSANGLVQATAGLQVSGGNFSADGYVFLHGGSPVDIDGSSGKSVNLINGASLNVTGTGSVTVAKTPVNPTDVLRLQDLSNRPDSTTIATGYIQNQTSVNQDANFRIGGYGMFGSSGNAYSTISNSILSFVDTDNNKFADYRANGFGVSQSGVNWSAIIQNFGGYNGYLQVSGNTVFSNKLKSVEVPTENNDVVRLGDLNSYLDLSTDQYVGGAKTFYGEGNYFTNGLKIGALNDPSGITDMQLVTHDPSDGRLYGSTLTTDGSNIYKSGSPFLSKSESDLIYASSSTHPDSATIANTYLKKSGGSIVGQLYVYGEGLYSQSLVAGGGIQVPVGSDLRFNNNNTAAYDWRISNDNANSADAALRIRQGTPSNPFGIDIKGSNIYNANNGKRFLQEGDNPDSATIANTYLAKSGGTMTGWVTLPSANPTDPLHAAPKAYIDNAITGITWKNAVRVKTTGNITLSGTQTIDGVSVVAGNRVLVNSQTDQTQNGIYVVAAGAWTRPTDADSGDELWTSTVAVTAGTTNRNTQWTCLNTSAPTVGSDAITYGQISGAGTYAASSGVSLSANVFTLDQSFTRGLFSATGPLTYNSGTGAFGINQASGSQDGYLSAANWNTFNNKQNAITLTSGYIGYSDGSTIVGSGGLFYSAINGNVGIGTTTPLAATSTRKAVVLRDATNNTTFRQEGANSIISEWLTTGSQAGIGTRSNNAFSIFTNAADALTILGSGFVGIGTTSPKAKLDVGGLITTAAVGNPAVYFSDNLNGPAGVELRNTSNGTSADTRFTISDEAGLSYLSIMQPSSTNAGTLFGLPRATTTYMFMNVSGGGVTRDLAIGNLAASNLYLATNSQPYFRMNSSGNMMFGGGGNPTHTITLPNTATGISYYNTADQTTNYERVRQYWSSNTYTIGSEFGGTGAARTIQLNAAATQLNVQQSSTGFQGTVEVRRDNTSTNTLFGVGSVGLLASSTMQAGMAIYPTINQSGTAGYRAIWVSPLETATGSGSKLLMDLGTNTAANALGTHASKFSVDNNGNTVIAGTLTSGGRRAAVSSVKTANYSTLFSDEIIPCNSTAGSFNVTLLSTAPIGTLITVDNTDGTANSVTVVGTINGATNYTLNATKTITLYKTATASNTWKIRFSN